jgi:signal transduction histidine kinase/ligand-binding sensor domain-containing protein
MQRPFCCIPLSVVALFWCGVWAIVYVRINATAQTATSLVAKPFAVKTLPVKPLVQSVTPPLLRSVQQRGMRFDALTIDNGLSQGTILSILQDKRGFLWFATQDGLNRYDGYAFHAFKHDPLDKFSISNSYVWSLCEDRDGILWIGTSGGLNRYDPKRSTFTSFQSSNDTTSISSNVVLSVAVDSTGIVWVGTDNGLNAFDPRAHGGRGAFTRFRAAAGGLPDNIINALAVDAAGGIWAGTANGLARYQPSSSAWTQFKHDAKNINSLAHNEVFSLAITHDGGTLWIGTRNGLTAIASPSSVQGQIANDKVRSKASATLTYQRSDTVSNAESTNRINALYPLRSGKVLLATNGGGVVIFDRATLQFTIWSVEDDSLFALLNNTVRSVFEDRQGLIWIGAYGNGINRCNPRRYSFTTIRHNPKQPNGLGNDVVWSFCETHDGMLWVGTFNDGVNVYNPTTKQWKHFRHSDDDPRSLSNNSVHAIVEASNGDIWLGTSEGLNVFNRTTNSFTAYKPNPTNPHAISHLDVRCLLKDSKGIIWAGTRYGGLNRVDVDARGVLSFTAYKHNSGDKRSLSHDYVSALCEDHTGTLWVGTSGGGINAFDRANGTFTRYLHEPSKSETIGSNYIRSIYDDHNSVLWIGTLGGGLSKLERQKTSNRADGGKQEIAKVEFITYRERDGLANNVIYGILEDASGNLWLSTNKGLSRFTPRTSVFRNYTARDGLQSNEFNTGAYMKSHDGHLYFGGMQGMNIFAPDSLRDNSYLPPVVLTGLKKFNKPVRLDSSLTEVSQIELGAEDVFFSIEFAALNFDTPEKNQYRYKLEGFDENWIDAGAKREATYTNLDGGTYRFHVKASNNDGLWNDDGAVVTIIVHPPWWKTWWFRSLLVAVGILALMAWFQWRTRAIRRQKEILKQQVAERTAELDASNQEVQRQLTILDHQAREIELANSELHLVNSWMEEKNVTLAALNNEKNEIMGIVAHDLKNPLSNIRLLARMLTKDAPTLNADTVRDLSSDIEESADRMFDLITNLLNVNAIEQGGMKLDFVPFDMTGLVKQVVHNYLASAEEKRITLHLEVLPILESSSNNQHKIERGLQGYLCFADRSATVQIIDNLVSNAVKYSPFDKNVIVCLRLSDDAQRVRVEVRDEGPGVSEEDMRKLFGKFARLSARPTGGEHSTGLGLSIVKKLAEAMNGNVWCESELGKGANFIVELPVSSSLS